MSSLYDSALLPLHVKLYIRRWQGTAEQRPHAQHAEGQQ